MSKFLNNCNHYDVGTACFRLAWEWSHPTESGFEPSLFKGIYMYSPKEVLDDEGKLRADPHTCPLRHVVNNTVLCFSRGQTWGNSLYLFMKQHQQDESRISIQTCRFFGKNLSISLCNFSFDCKAVVLLLLGMVLIPHYFICSLSKPCVDFRCMCISHWIQQHFLTTRIQLSAANGPSILQTPIAFSK